MAREKEDRVKEFIEHMKKEIAEIPQNLSVAEFLDRSERCASLSETLRQEGNIYKSKKYELLSRKYKQLAEEKQHPKPKIETIQAAPEVQPEPVIEEKKSLWSKLFGKKKANQTSIL